jgi:hypothetical protein
MEYKPASGMNLESLKFKVPVSYSFLRRFPSAFTFKRGIANNMLNKDNNTSGDKDPAGQSRKSSTGFVEKSGTSVHHCVSLPIAAWHPLLDSDIQKGASSALEDGNILLLPHLPFTLTAEESTYLRSDCLSSREDAIRFLPESQRLEGVSEKDKESIVLEALLKRYSDTTRDLIARLFPGYMPQLIMGKTSFSPRRKGQRSQGIRHDDRLLGVDAMRVQPSKGWRVLRILTNIHPSGQPFVWRVGETFDNLIARFLPKLRPPIPGSALLLRLAGVTRRMRTPYDHFMLRLREIMRRDARYQAEGPQFTLSFPAGSSWILFSDQVPHATMSGQYMLEQEFMIPSEALDNPETSPLRIMEKLMRRKLA